MDLWIILKYELEFLKKQKNIYHRLDKTAIVLLCFIITLKE